MVHLGKLCDGGEGGGRNEEDSFRGEWGRGRGRKKAGKYGV